MARDGDLFPSFRCSDELGESVVGITHAEVHFQIVPRILAKILRHFPKYCELSEAMECRFS
jgi:hypothetical protein